MMGTRVNKVAHEKRDDWRDGELDDYELRLYDTCGFYFCFYGLAGSCQMNCRGWDCNMS